MVFREPLWSHFRPKGRPRTRTVARELHRRRNCRFGLTGQVVRVPALAGQQFVVVASYWTREKQLRLLLMSPPDRAARAADVNRHADGEVTISAARLEQIGQRWRHAKLDVAAEEAVLESDWPMSCCTPRR